MGKSTPQHANYTKMEDTPWIKQGRQIADIGGKGVLDNYNKVNVFDEGTQASLNARNNAIYKRAFDDMERNYTDIMNKYNAKNYGQFGTLNATAPSYVTDQYRRDFQREMDDLAYNKAMNYDTLINNELQRRYNTLDMFGNMYGYGKIPYEQDVRNWNIDNTNLDVAYNNALMGAQNSGLNKALSIGTSLGGAALGGLGSGFGAGIASKLLGGGKI